MASNGLANVILHVVEVEGFIINDSGLEGKGTILRAALAGIAFVKCLEVLVAFHGG